MMKAAQSDRRPLDQVNRFQRLSQKAAYRKLLNPIHDTVYYYTPRKMIGLFFTVAASYAGYILRWFTRPRTVTHHSTNRAQRRVTSLIDQDQRVKH